MKEARERRKGLMFFMLSKTTWAQMVCPWSGYDMQGKGNQCMYGTYSSVLLHACRRSEHRAAVARPNASDCRNVRDHQDRPPSEVTSVSPCMRSPVDLTRSQSQARSAVPLPCTLLMHHHTCHACRRLTSFVRCFMFGILLSLRLASRCLIKSLVRRCTATAMQLCRFMHNLPFCHFGNWTGSLVGL